MFWVLIFVLIIIIGVGVGAGVGISMRKKGSRQVQSFIGTINFISWFQGTNISFFSSWQPYSLQTGAWNIDNIPLSQHNGICTNEYPTTAVSGCGPLYFPFIINQVGDNYQISSSPYPELNGLLSRPVGEGDMYQKSFYSTGQSPSVSSPCNSVANVTVKLGKAYQYEISK